MPETPSPTLPDLLDITQLAQHLGVQPRHIRRLVHEKRIPYVKWGHLIRFDPTTSPTGSPPTVGRRPHGQMSRLAAGERATWTMHTELQRPQTGGRRSVDAARCG